MMQSALLLFALAAPAAAVFKPTSKAELITVVNLCLDGGNTHLEVTVPAHPDGNCPELAAATTKNWQRVNDDDVTYGPIGTWDVSQITNMYQVFLDRDSFDQELSDWDVSSVTTFNQMFKGASSFNNGDNTGNYGRGINGWQFNGDPVNFNAMFLQAPSFTRNINDWGFSSTAVNSSK